MGGLLSGNRSIRDRKTTVEECIQFGVADLLKPLESSSGAFTAESRDKKRRAWLEYPIDLEHCEPYVEFRGPRLTRSSLTQVVYLKSKPARFGGHRWWFICPSKRLDGDCHCFVKFLYLPRNADTFACRHCHNLVHHSAQDPHFDDRYWFFWKRRIPHAANDFEIYRKLLERKRKRRNPWD